MKGFLNVVSALALLTTVAAKGIPYRRDDCPIPSQPLPKCTDHTYFPHPDSCKFFYSCEQGEPKCKECPAGLIWNPNLQVCDWPENYDCNKIRKRNQMRSSCPEINGIIPTCPFPDNTHSTYHAHPSDCHWFYQCSNGKAVCQECPATLHWNADLEVCDYPYRANCAASGTSASTDSDSTTTASSVTSEQTGSSTAKPCPAGRLPDCPFPDPAFSVFFPHENDCHWFYHCSNGIAYCKECPADLHWNVKLDTCDYPYRAGCATAPPSNSTTAAPPPSTTEDNTTPSDSATDTEASSETPTPTQSSTTSDATPVCPPGAAPVCPFPDPEHLVFFPHENDCHWFYQCAHGIAYCKECPAGLHWNSEKDICDFPENAGCAGGPSSPSTTENTTPSNTESPDPTQSTNSPAPSPCPAGHIPECPFPDPAFSVFFPHENDCHWFYHCSNGIAYCKECPADLHWNVKLDTCDYPYRAGCATAPPSNSTTAAPSPSTTEDNTTPSDSATDTEASSETPTPTQSSTTSDATPVCPPGAAPVCPFPDPEHLVFFPHENDCHWFYQCAHGIAYCKECPAGLHWNSEKDICDFPENAGCAGGPSSPSTTENTTPSNTESPDPTQSTNSPAPSPCPAGHIPECPFPDPAFSVFFPHENDCHWFYHCSNGIAYCKECPADLHWNVKLDTCDYPYRAGCATAPPSNSTTAAPPPSTTEDNTTPSDSATDTEASSETPTPTQSSTTSDATPVCPPGAAPVCPFPDPEHLVFFPHENDCHWFYQCAHGIAYCKECPAGLHWNSEKDICDFPENAGCAGGPSSPSTTENTTPSNTESPDPTQSTNSPAPSPCPAGHIPECPFPDPAFSVFFPHENDCHWFYHCSNGIAYCKECPADLHWNVKLDTCDYPYRAGCATAPPSNSTTAAPPPSTTEDNTTPSDSATDTEASSETPTPTQSSTTSDATPVCPPGAAPVCPFPDPEHLVFFPHENDCHWFYQCAHGIAYCKECPAGLHWNSEKDICDFPENAGCAGGPSSPSTTENTTPSNTESPDPTQSTNSPAPSPCPAGHIPECPFPDPAFSVFFPHENDCHWFYHCSNGIAYCKECPADLHWNVKLDTCDYPYRAGCATAPPSNSTTAAPPPSTTEDNTTPSDSATDTEASSETPTPTQSSTTSDATPVCPPGAAPVCPFPDPEHLVFFPHENDCHWFYQCAHGIAYCKECPAGLHWNSEKDICDFPENAGCAGGPSSPSTTENTTPSNTESPDPTQSTNSPAPSPCPAGHIPECPFPDPAFSVFFPHENDCHWFYHCSNGIAYCKECPADLHWNVKLDTCDYPYRAGCAMAPPSSSTTAAPSSPTTEDNTIPSDSATDTEASSETPIPTEGTSSPMPKPCPIGRIPTCPFPDPAFSVFFPHENNCHWFYHCSNGVAYCKECPADLHWNVKLDTCDYPYRAGCSAISKALNFY